MTKKFLCMATVLMSSMAMFTSCSDNDDPTPAKVISEGTYTDGNGLTLTLNGNPLLGKTAKFTPDANDASKGTLTLNSTFNLSAIPGVPESLSRDIAGPGVIPGSPETVLQLTLDTNDNKATFSGEGENTYCTYKYSGTVTDNSVALNIVDLTLKNQTLAGAYTLQPYDVNDDWTSDDYGTVYSEPIYAVWESSADLNFLGTDMPIQNLLSLLMAMPLLDDMSVRVPDKICELLQGITLGTDGNIIAKYADLESESPAYLQSPANMAQYVVAGNNKMLFFLNPQAVINDAARSRGIADIDINNLLGNVIAQLAPMMAEGVPMNFTQAADGNTTIYLATETLLPLLKTNVLPLLRDKELVQMLSDLIASNEDFAFLAPMIPDMISSAADVIEGTTKLEIGLNFKK